MPRHPTEIRLEVERAFDEHRLIDYASTEIERLERAISETVKWVPVTERLPDPIDSYVLVQGVNPKLYERREFHVCQLWDDDHGYLNHPSEWRWMTEAGNVIDDVTHWMPLPEAPK